MGTPIFTFQGNDYACIPSVNSFQRDLEEGGFSTGKLLTMDVPLVDSSGNDLFTVLPQPQNLLTYNGEQYRIEMTEKHPTGTYLIIRATNTTKGI